MGKLLKAQLGAAVLGPAIPGISRVRTYYLRELLLKLDKRTAHLKQVKELINESFLKVRTEHKTLWMVADVDPM